MTSGFNEQSEAFKGFKQFMQGLTPADKIALQHDTDADGVSAGAITAHAIHALTGKFPEVVFFQGRDEPPLGSKRVEWLREQGVTKFISVDISLDQHSRKEWLEEIATFADCLNIDHHKMYSDRFDSPRAFLIKPQHVCDIDPSKYACGKFCYDLFVAVGIDLKKYDWKASIGILGDVAYSQWKDFVDASLAPFGITPPANWYESEPIGTVLQVISSVGSIEIEALRDVYHAVLEANQPTDLLTEYMMHYVTVFNAAMKQTEDDFFQNKEVYPENELVFYRFTTPMIGTGVLINRLSFLPEYYHMTILMAKDSSPEKTTFSCRRQDGQVKCNELLEKCVEGLEGGSAGGHIPAAGGIVGRKDWNVFKERLLTLTKKKKMEELA